ncbi:MAG: cytochrome c-type biogenesis protein [Alphaproteobacteria bacterium]
MTSLRMMIVGAFMGLLLLPTLALAVAVDENPLADPALEQQVQDISKTLRCLVCQNQSIEDSNSDLAKDLRNVVRERVAAGDNDDQVRAYMVDRYGEWVLMSPPVSQRTYVLWLGPLALVLVGLFAIIVMMRRRAADGTQIDIALSDEDKARAKALLKGNDE